MTYKTVLIATLLLGGQAFSQDDEAVGKRTIEMRPTEKRSLTLKPSERNPYAKRLVQADENDETEQSDEELAIRKKLRSLTVTGESRDRNGVTLLMGDVQIQRGKVLPQLIPTQSQFLKVKDITDKKIVLGWMDIETGQLTGKDMTIPYDLSPFVRFALQGQVAEEGGLAKEPEMGIMRPNRASQKAPPGFIKNR